MNPGPLLILIPLILVSIILLVLFMLEYKIRVVKENDYHSANSGTNVTFNHDRAMTDMNSNVNSNSNVALSAQLNSIHSGIDDTQDVTIGTHKHTFDPVAIDWESVLNKFPGMATAV